MRQLEYKIEICGVFFFSFVPKISVWKEIKIITEKLKILKRYIPFIGQKILFLGKKIV